MSVGSLSLDDIKAISNKRSYLKFKNNHKLLFWGSFVSFLLAAIFVLISSLTSNYTSHKDTIYMDGKNNTVVTSTNQFDYFSYYDNNGLLILTNEGGKIYYKDSLYTAVTQASGQNHIAIIISLIFLVAGGVIWIKFGQFDQPGYRKKFIEYWIETKQLME